jgi:hypothetical protein
MEALFDSDVILSDEPEPKTIVCDCFKNGKPIITVLLHDKSRETAKKALYKYIDFDIRNITPKDLEKLEKYTYDTMTAAYDHSEGMFTQDSKEVMLAYLKKRPAFAQWLAVLLVGVFQGDDELQIANREEEEKN